MDQNIDIVEQRIQEIDPELLAILLRDETTGQNIRWACEDYASLGDGYAPEDQILPALITGEHTNVIRPRILKETETQAGRTRGKAEVFTPSWVCNEQNNIIDGVYASSGKDVTHMMLRLSIIIDGRKSHENGKSYSSR